MSGNGRQQISEAYPRGNAPALADCYLTETEFSERYNLSPRTAQRWRATGAGGPPFVRMGLRRVAYRLSDCETWAAGRTYTSRAAELSKQAA